MPFRGYLHQLFDLLLLGSNHAVQLSFLNAVFLELLLKPGLVCIIRPLG
jgi:hypothetical protein